MVIVAKGSDGSVHDLHRIEQDPLMEAPTRDVAFVESRVVWLTSTGAVATTDDERTFQVGEDLLLTKIGEIPTER